MATQNELLDAAFASYEDGINLPPEGYVQATDPDLTMDDSTTGMYVTTYYNSEKNEYIVAFRGTEDGQDWVNNTNRGWPQYEQNQERIQSLLSSLTASGATVEITGHSLVSNCKNNLNIVGSMYLVPRRSLRCQEEPVISLVQNKTSVPLPNG